MLSVVCVCVCLCSAGKSGEVAPGLGWWWPKERERENRKETNKREWSGREGLLGPPLCTYLYIYLFSQHHRLNSPLVHPHIDSKNHERWGPDQLAAVYWAGPHL